MSFFINLTVFVGLVLALLAIIFNQELGLNVRQLSEEYSFIFYIFAAITLVTLIYDVVKKYKNDK